MLHRPFLMVNFEPLIAGLIYVTTGLLTIIWAGFSIFVNNLEVICKLLSRTKDITGVRPGLLNLTQDKKWEKIHDWTYQKLKNDPQETWPNSGYNSHMGHFRRIFCDNFTQKIYSDHKINMLNSHAPDQFTPSRARCAENCGSALTYR